MQALGPSSPLVLRGFFLSDGYTRKYLCMYARTGTTGTGQVPCRVTWAERNLMLDIIL